jgi:hypothetical protein
LLDEFGSMLLFLCQSPLIRELLAIQEVADAATDKRAEQGGQGRPTMSHSFVRD